MICTIGLERQLYIGTIKAIHHLRLYRHSLSDLLSEIAAISDDQGLL